MGLQISCKDLAVGYDGNAVIGDLNFDIYSGDYLCIIGENGAGKSTLMKTMLGFIQPLSGTINKADVSIGYLPQQTPAQKDFPASVFEVVLSGVRHKGPFYNSSQKHRARTALYDLGIENLKNRCYRELSGGQQQRVLLARAICASRDMILLDEPVSGLDPKATEEMYLLIEKLNKGGMTVVMISHDMNAAEKYATDILCLTNPSLGKATFMSADKYYERSKT